MNQAYPRRTASGLYFETKEDWEKYVDEKLNVGSFKVSDWKKEYNARNNALARCENKNHLTYSRFGGRGIRFDDAWKGFEGFIRFLKHVGPAPSPRHSIERVLPWGHYEPKNVIGWATPKEQRENQRRHWVEYEWQGKSLTIFQWARELNTSGPALYRRIRESRWPIAKALSTPVRSYGTQRVSEGLLP